MKRISLIIISLLLLAGCSLKSEPYSPPETPVIIAPDSKAEETADGYKIPKEEIDIMYYANKESMKIHLPSCHYAKSMSESKVRLEKDYSALIADGYSPCAICNPQ